MSAACSSDATQRQPCRSTASAVCLTPSERLASSDNARRKTMTQASTSRVDPRTFVKNIHGVRYQVKDVARSVAFYTEQLGFTLEHQHLPAFAAVSLGEANILLSGPEASGSRP